jgi:elongation factor 1-gamma
MIRNLDHFRKYAFGVLGLYGDEGDFAIRGTWLWRGTEIPQEWKDHNAYDYTTFKRLDHTKEEDRKLIESSWTVVGDSEELYLGKPIWEAKWFK